MNDSEDVLKRVQAALESEPRVALHHSTIGIATTPEGTLRLAGEVGNIAARKLALRLAREASGAPAVDDRLQVSPSAAKSDGEILETLTQFMVRECDLKNCTLRRRYRDRLESVHEVLADDRSGDILYSAVDGVIILEGHVISLSHRRLAEVLAWWVPGCRRVDNRLQVAPAEADNDDEITDAVRLALELDHTVHADQIAIATRAGTVSLDGIVTSKDEVHRAEMDAWYVPGVEEVVNRIAVQA